MSEGRIAELRRALDNDPKLQWEVCRHAAGGHHDADRLEQLRQQGKKECEELSRLEDERERQRTTMGEVIYFGWIPGHKSDIPALRAHGVRGEMTFKADDISRLATAWRTVSRLFGVWHRTGVIENCECTEDVMEHLIEEWPVFWPSTFTGCLPPYGNDDQVPREQQKYGATMTEAET